MQYDIKLQPLVTKPVLLLQMLICAAAARFFQS